MDCTCIYTISGWLMENFPKTIPQWWLISTVIYMYFYMYIWRSMIVLIKAVYSIFYLKQQWMWLSYACDNLCNKCISNVKLPLCLMYCRHGINVIVWCHFYVYVLFFFSFIGLILKYNLWHTRGNDDNTLSSQKCEWPGGVSKMLTSS